MPLWEAHNAFMLAVNDDSYMLEITVVDSSVARGKHAFAPGRMPKRQHGT